MKFINILMEGRYGDLTAEYIVNEDGERILDAIIAAKWSMSFGDILGKHSDVQGTVDPEDVMREDVLPAKRAAYEEIYGVLNANSPWRHLRGNIDPLGYAADHLRDDASEGPLEGETLAAFMLRAGNEGNMYLFHRR